MNLKIFAGFIAVAALSGCNSLPAAGPTTDQVLAQARKQSAHFDLVEIAPTVANVLSSQPEDELSRRLASFGRPPGETIGIGDSVSISIWESSAGGLFGVQNSTGTGTEVSPSGVGEGSHMTSIPEQVVGADGGVTVPYAGRVRAAGRTPLQVQSDIEQRLAGRAMSPKLSLQLQKTSETTSRFRVNWSVARACLSP